ncbi:MAG: AraC family transcriptional regulator [Candidatus Nanoarchaeia archaeon]
MKIPGQVNVQYPDDLSLKRMELLCPYVRQSGDTVRKQWYTGERKLLDYLLVCVMSGTGVFSVGDNKYFPVSVGNIIWIPPDTIHSMRGTSETMHLAYIHFDLCFDPKRSIWDAHIPPFFLDSSPFKKILHPKIKDSLLGRLTGKIISDDKSGIISQVREICAIHRLYGNSAILELSGMMTRLIACIINEVQNASGHTLHKLRLDEAYRQIYNSEKANLSIAKIAKEAGFSVSHFRRLFKEVYRVNPASVHRKGLMRKAHDLIFYERLNVSETAERLGFKNIHNFSRSFKNYYGKSPSEMIK